MTQQVISTPGGRIAFRREGSGVPLVLLHGNGLSLHEFDRVVEPLAQQFDVIAWDQPGHGGSDPLPGEPSVAGFAAALQALLDALGVAKVAVVGSSIGAFVATELARAFPRRVGALVLCEAQWRTDEWWAERWGIVEGMFGTAELSLDQLQARLVSAEAETLLEQWNRDRKQAGPRQMLAVMSALRAYNLGHALSRLEQPVKLLYGESSPTVDNAATLNQACPQAEVSVIEGAGHYPALDQPARFVSQLSDFFQALRAKE